MSLIFKKTQIAIVIVLEEYLLIFNKVINLKSKIPNLETSNL